MYNNRNTLENLFKNKKIDVKRGSVFDVLPGAMPDSFKFERIEGMMLGLAIGDALGNTTEGSLPQDRKNKHGEIRDYLPNRYANNSSVGLPTDDTQLAFWTLEQLIKDRSFNPKNLSNRFCQDRIFGIGSAVSRFRNNFKVGKPWDERGTKSAGNGALMRIAPIVIPHLKTGDSELWVDTALSAMLTHNDSASISACITFVYMLWDLLKMELAPDPFWWPDTYVKIGKDLEIDENYKPRGGDFQKYQGTVWQLVQKKVGDAYQKKIRIRNACLSWYSGAYLLETVPSVIYILMKHGDNLEEAIIRAVNDTKDNDTIGAIVGAAVGALHGRSAIPERWIKNLKGRTSDSDDDRVFELLAEAKKIWEPSKEKNAVKII